MKTVGFIVALLCFGLIGVGYYFASQDQGNSSARIIPMDDSVTQRVTVGGWVQGSLKPSVTVIEYADFQCDGCRSLYPVLNQSIAATSSFAQFQFRQYPITSEDKDELAAIASEAAGRQGKFWDYHDLLYARLSEWQKQSAATFENTLLNYASILGLNSTQFNQDVLDAGIQAQINTDEQAGIKAGIKQTPTLLINGKIINLDSVPDSNTLTKIIQNARS